jgi:hypothetical protein
MSTNYLKNRRAPGRIVLFGFKGKTSAKKLAGNSVEETADITISQHRIIDFATLASWYAEQNAVNDIDNEWSTPRIYAEKQRNLRFLTL